MTVIPNVRLLIAQYFVPVSGISDHISAIPLQGQGALVAVWPRYCAI